MEQCIISHGPPEHRNPVLHHLPKELPWQPKIQRPAITRVQRLLRAEGSRSRSRAHSDQLARSGNKRNHQTRSKIMDHIQAAEISNPSAAHLDRICSSEQH
ncbi:hypothetical protein ACLOJK_003602 [Asimina triloba]